MLNVNAKQWLSITVAILSVLMISTTQLTDLFGPGIAKTMVTIAGLANTIISSVVAAISSQSALINDTLAMPGVEKISVNSHANSTLASMAIDPSIDKIAPLTSDREAVEAIAKGK